MYNANLINKHVVNKNIILFIILKQKPFEI